MPTDSAAQRLLPHLRRVALAGATETGDGSLLGAFVATRDEAAFAALVRRHGPMVLGVCRRVIGDPHLAEDAFQATFLVLARRAAVVRPRHLVGHWLYGVAYRTALKARGAALRRMAKEKQVDAMPQPPVSPEAAWSDLQAVLDAELARLPDKYRIPVVLCDLEGRTQRDVSRELQLPAATLARRLAAARRLLAKRLTARGVALSAGAVAAALGWHAATSAVPPALAKSTVKAACAAAAGTAVGLPVPVLQLSDGVMRMFVLNKLKSVATGVATGLVVLAGLGLVADPSLRAGPDEKPTKPVPATKADSAKPADPHRPPPDDLTFLRRTSLDLRGTLPTALEGHYFLADTDPKKRTKIVEWMLPEHGHMKATDACTKCHTAPFSPPVLNKIPYFDRLFKNTDGHGAGVRIADFDLDGFPDIIIADELYLDLTGQMGLEVPKPVDPKSAEASKLAVEQAKADVASAEADVRLAEAQRKAGPVPVDGRQTVDQAWGRLEIARIKLKQAEANLKSEAAAEAQRRDYVRVRLRAAQALSQADRITKDLDAQIKERWTTKLLPSDADFLRRVMLDVTGVPPTTVEQNYFVADKDPKKREKLLGIMLGKADKPTARDKLVENLLADPEVQKRWAQLQQQRIYEEQIKAAHEAWQKKPADRLDRLLADLIERKKSDEQMLNALCLATLARYPTETEQKLILDGLKTHPDRAAAWQGVLKALAATDEVKAYAAELTKRGGK